MALIVSIRTSAVHVIDRFLRTSRRRSRTAVLRRPRAVGRLSCTSGARDRDVRVLARRVALVAATLCALPPVGRAATLEEIRERGYLVVATQDNLPPFEYSTSRGVIGYDNELLIGLREASGLKIRHEVAPLCDVLAGVASGKYDVAATALPVEPHPPPAIVFTAPVAVTSTAYIVRKDNDAIRNADDLRGKAIGVQKCSGLAAASLRASRHSVSRPAGRIIEFDSYADAYQDLVAGRIDAIVGTGASLGAMARETSGLLHSGVIGAGSLRIAWGVQKDNRDLLHFLNAHLAQQRASGTLARLQLKYDLLGNGS